jgi:uroporphyrinogen decarboxylase
MTGQGMTKRERLEATIAREPVDRPAVALWRHFPGDDQRPEDLAAATAAFQREYDFDFVKVTPASSFCLTGWGAQDRWVGSLEGTRQYTGHPVQDPADWGKLVAQSPTSGSLGRQLRCLELLISDLGPDVPVIQTIFSPLSQAKNLVGPDALPVHMRRYRGALTEGLHTITETTVRFVRELRELGVAGVFYAVQHARYGVLSEAEYTALGRPNDLAILEACGDLWLNVLHLHGRDVMFDLLADYPVHIVNWHDQETWPSLSEGQLRFAGAVCGGLRRWEDLVQGTPDRIRGRAQAALEETGERGLVLGTGCVTPVVTPASNLRAARRSVERHDRPPTNQRVADG